MWFCVESFPGVDSEALPLFQFVDASGGGVGAVLSQRSILIRTGADLGGDGASSSSSSASSASSSSSELRVRGQIPEDQWFTLVFSHAYSRVGTSKATVFLNGVCVARSSLRYPPAGAKGREGGEATMNSFGGGLLLGPCSFIGRALVDGGTGAAADARYLSTLSLDPSLKWGKGWRGRGGETSHSSHSLPLFVAYDPRCFDQDTQRFPNIVPRSQQGGGGGGGDGAGLLGYYDARLEGGDASVVRTNCMASTWNTCGGPHLLLPLLLPRRFLNGPNSLLAPPTADVFCQGIRTLTAVVAALAKREVQMTHRASSQDPQSTCSGGGLGACFGIGFDVDPHSTSGTSGTSGRGDRGDTGDTGDVPSGCAVDADFAQHIASLLLGCEAQILTLPLYGAVGELVSVLNAPGGAPKVRAMI